MSLPTEANKHCGFAADLDCRVNEVETAAGLAPTPGYRYAQRVGNELFVAGQVPHNAQGGLVGADDAHAQAVQCLANLRVVLAAHGFGWQDIRRLVVYAVGDAPNLHHAWRAITEAFANGVPPATLLGVARLGYTGQLVEIDATVVRAAP
jgi:enamine deaminase RidA (YjgF/YER057c/UK114 family)